MRGVSNQDGQKEVVDQEKKKAGTMKILLVAIRSLNSGLSATRSQLVWPFWSGLLAASMGPPVVESLDRNWLLYLERLERTDAHPTTKRLRCIAGRMVG